MIEFLNNLFSSSNQQIPVALQNPDPENPNSPNYRQNVYDRQISPMMRAGIQSPLDQTRFEPMPVAAPPQMGMNPAQAAQQQEMLKRYAMANMGRMGGQSGLVEQPPVGAGQPIPPGYDPVRAQTEQRMRQMAEEAEQRIGARTFPLEARQPMPKPEEIPAQQSQQDFLNTLFAGGEEPMLSKLIKAGQGLSTGVNIDGVQAAPMTREAAGYVPTGIETLIPGANTIGIDFRNVVMNPARKRLSNLLGIQ